MKPFKEAAIVILCLIAGWISMAVILETIRVQGFENEFKALLDTPAAIVAIGLLSAGTFYALVWLVRRRVRRNAALTPLQTVLFVAVFGASMYLVWKIDPFVRMERSAETWLLVIYLSFVVAAVVLEIFFPPRLPSYERPVLDPAKSVASPSAKVDKAGMISLEDDE